MKSFLFGIILVIDLIALVIFVTCPHPHGESITFEELSCVLIAMVMLAFGLLYSREDRTNYDDDSGDDN